MTNKLSETFWDDDDPFTLTGYIEIGEFGVGGWTLDGMKVRRKGRTVIVSGYLQSKGYAPGGYWTTQEIPYNETAYARKVELDLIEAIEKRRVYLSWTTA